MQRRYDRPVVIQKQDPDTQRWSDAFRVHAYINKKKTDGEYLTGGAIQVTRKLVFEIRYFAALEDIAVNSQLYRLSYNGVTYDIKDYDDYLFKHKTVKLLGESY